MEKTMTLGQDYALKMAGDLGRAIAQLKITAIMLRHNKDQYVQEELRHINETLVSMGEQPVDLD